MSLTVYCGRDATQEKWGKKTENWEGHFWIFIFKTKWVDLCTKKRVCGVFRTLKVGIGNPTNVKKVI